MSSRYRLVPADDDEHWDDFVRRSENGTVFNNSAYLSAISRRVGRYYCLKNHEPRAALAIIESSDGAEVIQDELYIYNGVMFSGNIRLMNHARQHSERFRIAEFIATELAGAYQRVDLTFHPTVVDIRPFLWVNYGSDRPQYVPDVRYTSYVDITGFEAAGSYEDAEIFRRASPSRRQEIRYAADEQIATAEVFDPETFLEYYHLTMARQSITVPSKDLDKMRRIMGNLQDRGMGRMFASYSRSGVPGSFAFFGIDSKRGYYLFGANHPDMRDQHCGTQVLWEAFQALCRDGVRTVDLEGVNSPYRGWFKLSFGGNLIPYYSVRYSAVNAGQTGANTVREADLP